MLKEIEKHLAQNSYLFLLIGFLCPKVLSFLLKIAMMDTLITNAPEGIGHI